MAILKVYDILLDIKRATTNNKIEVVEGDNGNVFRIFLTDNNEPVDLSGTKVVAVFSSGDGTAEQDTSDTAFGEYTLTWDGDVWVINSLRTVDDLDLCGITLTGGTPAVNDTVTVTYNEDGATAVTSIAGATVTVDRTTFARSLASVMIGGADNNEIDILVRAGSYSSSGINECEIQIYSGDDDVLVTTAKFNFQSRRSSLNDETLVSEEKFPILVSLIAQANDALARAYKFTNVNASATDLAPHSSATASVTVGDDSVTFVFGIPLPNGIVSVTKSGTGAAGTKDTYTITFSDNTTFSFEVYNGNDGVGVLSVSLISGDHSAGTTDVYRMTFTNGTYVDFGVYNGKDGQGSPGSSLPKALGTANAGSAVPYSREDHVHPKPSPADIGAVPTTRTVNGHALSSNVTIEADDVPTDTVGVSVQDKLDSLDNSKAETATYTATIGTTWDGADAVHEATGAIVEFVAEESMALVDLSADINAVQSGSGDPSPSNVRPISGWSAVNVVRAGKNLCSINALSTNPGIYWGSNNLYMVAFLNTLPTGTYTLYVTQEVVTLPANGKVTHGRPYLTAIVNGAQTPVLSYRVTNDDSPIVGKTYRDGGTFTITDAIRGNFNNCYFYCDQQDTHTGSERGTYNVKDIQLELGSTATAYEAYDGDTYTIDLDGTRYGGSLDVTTGVLTVTHQTVDLGLLSWTRRSNPNGNLSSTYLFSASPNDYGPAKSNFVGVLSSYKWVTNYNNFAEDCTAGYIYGTQIAIRDDSYTDAIAFKSAVDGQQCCYELATPLTVQLTAQQVDTLVGQNVIWADSGDVDVQYKVTSSQVPYSQVVSVSGLLATDNPIVDIVPSDTYATAETQLEAWGSIYRIVAGANQITVYATDETSVSIPIQLKCVR